MLPPKLFDSFIRFLPLRYRRPPVCEFSRGLSGGTKLTRNAQRLAHCQGQRIGLWLGRAGYAEAEAAEVIILIVVAVPAAVTLIQLELELRAAGGTNWFFEK